MIDPDVAMTYLDFVAERHRVWEARQAGETGPWTADPILAAHKFTNVFRVLDPGSQFVFDLEDEDPAATLMRLFLYRHTGRVDSWREITNRAAHLPGVEGLDRFLEIFKSQRAEGMPVFTNAYLVYPQSSVKGTDKLESIVDLTWRLFHTDSPTELVTDFMAAGTQQERFGALRRNIGVEDLMSMQILTDWGYTRHVTEDLEDSFVVCGPGATRGAAALASGWPAARTLKWAVDAVRSMPDCPRLGDRVPSYMDVQNTLCEFSKYVRFAAKPPAAKLYRPAHPGPQTPPVLPRHW